MLLNIYGKIPEGETLLIKVDNEIKFLDSINPNISFDIVKKQIYEIHLEQPISKSNITPLNLLIFLLTAAIQGIFNILLINTNSDWHKKIKAYCLKATLVVNLHQDTDIHIAYINSKYDKNNDEWLLPVLTVKPDIPSTVNYVINPHDFKNQYINYVKRVASVAIILVVVLTFILSSAIIKSNIIAIISVSLLMFGVVLLVVMLSITQHKKLKKLYQSFLNQSS
jgi:lysylphosphatidylglycerol synthetase-like protein (DUF2156 family)